MHASKGFAPADFNRGNLFDTEDARQELAGLSTGRIAEQGKTPDRHPIAPGSDSHDGLREWLGGGRGCSCARAGKAGAARATPPPSLRSGNLSHAGRPSSATCIYA